MAVTVPRLEVAAATVQFHDTVAVDGVNLDVSPGEVVVILGPSGSGKSTLLRAIAGLQPLDTGRVALDGADVTDVPPHRRGVGLMFQDHALFPHRDVAGNVAFGLRMAGVDAGTIAHRVHELLELVDLGGFGGRRIDTLSGGERQRVALARALAPEPRLLLLDEPLGSLDEALRERLAADLSNLFARLSVTVIAVTHDRGEAFAMADRVLVMDHGRRLQLAPPRDIWRGPATRRVAELVGFANIVVVEVVAGIASTPWGPVPVDASDGERVVAVPETEVVLDPAGPVTGTVTSSTFRGEQTDLTVAVPGGPDLHATVSGATPPTGATVRLRLAGAALVAERR